MTSEHILIFSEELVLYQELARLLPPMCSATHLATADALREALQNTADDLLLVFALSSQHAAQVLLALQEGLSELPLVCITRASVPASMVNTLLSVNLQALIEYPFQPRKVQETMVRALASAKHYTQHRQLKYHLAEANRQLNQRLQEINAIYTVGKSVTSSLEVDEVLERIVDASANLTQAEEGFILLEENGKLYLRMAKNMNEEIAQRFYVEASDPIAWQVIRSGRPTLLHRDTKIATGYLVRSLLYVPLLVPGRGPIGVLGVVNLLTTRTFTENHLFTLSSIADYAATALENARLFSLAKEERSRLSAILEHAAEAILVTDMDNRLWLWSESAAENFHIEPEAQGQEIEAYIENASIRELFSRAHDEGEIVRAEVDLEGGRVFNVQLSSINHIGRVAVMQDITHLKELNRLKTEFVSTVSHDLRTPLMTVQGYIELLERVGPLAERQKIFIDKALASLSHITDLIGDLLDIGRIEAGYRLEMRPCCVNAIVQEMAEAHVMQCAKHRLRFDIEVPEQPLWIQGNVRRLRQVLDNLVSNAIKYSRPDGWVKIVVQADGAYVVVRVEDNGIGIAVEEQPKIFERFYRVQSLETESINGTGLGLAIVKSVIEKHKGRIWVQSAPDVGSTFAFALRAISMDAVNDGLAAHIENL